MRSSSPEKIIVLCDKWRCEAVCMSRFVELVLIWSLLTDSQFLFTRIKSMKSLAAEWKIGGDRETSCP